ncbi:hypothetical protein DBT54_08400 [Aerococcus loyolae]|uniref:Uncharacterized protein n=1 Tax=Aerococcus urinae TaxID=1376 RepID=A0A329P230_9LACT|nr:hypothetical protein DBT54_08400 [Aerococcus loyolae]
MKVVVQATAFFLLRSSDINISAQIINQSKKEASNKVYKIFSPTCGRMECTIYITYSVNKEELL